MKKSIKMLFFTIFGLLFLCNYALADLSKEGAVVYTIGTTTSATLGDADKVLLYPYQVGTTTVSFNTAVNDARNKTLVVYDNVTIGTGTTVGTETSLIVPQGGKFNFLGSPTLSINGPFQAGLYQIFSGTATVSFGTGTVNEIHPEWWGALFYDTKDDALAIQKAIDTASSVGGMVQLPAGVATTGTSTVIKPKVRIVGAGRGLTTINYTGTSTAITTDTTAKEYMGIEKLTISTLGSGIRLINGRHGIYRDLEIITNGTGTNTVCLQLEDGSWENSFYDCIFDGNDEAGTRSTKGVYQIPTTDAPNVNRFVNCIFKELHYGFWADDGYDTCLIAPRFVKTRYHMVIGDDANRFKSIASSHEANTSLQPALQFTNGTSTVLPGSEYKVWQGIYGSPTAFASVANVEVDNGSWTTGSAGGFFYLYDKTGTFAPTGTATSTYLKIGTSSTNVGTATISGDTTKHFVLAKVGIDNDSSAVMFPGVVSTDEFNIHDLALSNGTVSSFSYNYRDSWNLKSRRSNMNEPIFNFAQAVTPKNDRVVRIRSRSSADSSIKMFQIVKGDTESSLTELAAFYGNGDADINGDLTIGSGTAIHRYLFGTSTISFGTLSPNAVVLKDVSMQGVVYDDNVFVAPNDNPGTNTIWSARCKGTATVEIRLANPTNGTVTTTDRGWRISVIKH